MKKAIIGIVATLILVSVGLLQFVPALADSTGPLSYVEISPVNPSIVQGGTLQFSVQGYDNDDNAIAGANYFWMVDNNDSGTITQTGLFTAGTNAGTYADAVQVVAVKGSYSATLTTSVTVLPVGALDHVEITPNSATVVPGGTFQFTAQGYDNSDIAISGLSYQWGLTDLTGSISETGLLTVSSGVATGIFTDAVHVIVTDAGITRTGYATVTVAPIGTLNHIIITPSAASVQAGKSRQFTATGYDVNDAVISDLTFTWSVINGGGTISNNGLFTAGSIPGTYSNTVRATVTNSNIYGYASVTVTAVPNTNQPLNMSNLIRLCEGLVSNTNFTDFLGGQWQVKNGTEIDTVKVIPGVVVSFTSPNLVINPNLQTSPSVFSIASDTVMQPRNTTLAVGDQVLVVTVNDEVKMVVEITSNTTQETQQMPPGLRKNQENREGKATPPGWSHGNKTGWGDRSGDEGED